MAETLQDRLLYWADKSGCVMPATARETMREAASKLDELESRLSRHDTGREEMRKALFEADDALRIAGAGEAVTIRLETKAKSKKAS